MAIKGMTGFDFYGQADAPICGWTQPFTVAVGPGRFSAGAGNWNPSLQTIDNRFALTAATNASPFVGFAWKYSAPVAEQAIITLADGSTGQVTLTWDGTAQVFKVRAGQGITGTVIGTSAAQTGMAQNVWNHLELLCLIADSSGTIQLKMNGTAVFTATGDTKASSTAQITHLVLPALNGAGGNVLMSYDDMYCVDSTGAAPTASVGDVQIRWLKPISDGSHSDFTPSSGSSHYDKVASLAGSTNVASATVGAKDSYHLQTVPTTSVVLGVKVNLGFTKTDAGSRSVEPYIKGTTEHIGTPVAIASSLKVYSQIFEQNPDTSAAWTAAEVNAAEFGAEIAA